MNYKDLIIHKQRYSRTSISQSNFEVYSTYFDFDESYNEGSNYEEEKEITPQSQFGTRQYWDDTYIGRGDFPMEEYSWYYGWDDTIKKVWMNEVLPKIQNYDNDEFDVKEVSILIPGIGNDSILLDLYNAGWRNLTAFDYSQYAIDRQYDLLYNSNVRKGLDNGNVQLHVMDATDLNEDSVISGETISWTEQFDIIFEKGALDAIYLSSSEGDERIPVQMSVVELTRVLKKGGLFVSVSGVLPEPLRRQLFLLDEWEWIRDGSDDLQAGFFIWKKI